MTNRTPRTPSSTRRRGRRSALRGGLSRSSRRRLFALLVAFGVAFLLIGAKLVSVQGLSSARYQHYGTRQSEATVSLPALRGSILASNGDELAMSEMRDLVFADPTEISAAAAGADARRLAPLLGRSAATVRAELTEHTTYVPLVAGASDALGARVAALAITGVGVEQSPVRYYPAGTIAAPILGALNANGANGGLESEYDKALTGTPGKIVESVDPSGHPVPGSVTEDVPAVDGDDIVTTIDEALQYQTEQALSGALASSHGTAATAIVENTRTGALLAVANLASNGRGGKPTEAQSATAFTNVYEPGSVAKIVTVSGALASGDITPGEVFTIPNGYPVAGTVFHDAEPHPTEQLSVTGILAQSSDIGAIQIAQRMGAARLYHYEQAFGLTRKTDVGFPGESAGLVTPLSKFNGTTLPTLAYGDNNAVTAAQMTSAINTIADGGVYVPPRLVTAEVGPDGRQIPLPAPRPHRVVPSWVARAITPMLEQVVSTGTGVPAQVAGYAIAGKTGTGASLSTHGAGYSATRNTASFAGFAPAQDPRITVMVVVDHTTDYGAQASAPAFHTIMKDALLDLEIPSAGPQPKALPTAVPTVNGQVQRSLLQ